jgi:hypothetical protein
MCGEIFIVCRLDEGEWTIGTVEQSHVNPNSGYQAMATRSTSPLLMATPGAPFSDRPSKGFSLSESEPCDDDPLGAADLAEPVAVHSSRLDQQNFILPQVFVLGNATARRKVLRD